MAQAKQNVKIESWTTKMLLVYFADNVTNAKQKLEAIEGITSVQADGVKTNVYFVYTNPCYDIDDIVAEIEQIT